MSRSTDEWIAKNDDAAIPPRVKERVARKSDDCCRSCQRKIGGKLRAEYDHVIPLIIGGSHRESNLQLLCNECHGEKTKLDVKLKAKVARIHKRELGIRSKSSRPMPGSRASGFKRRMDGTVERRT